MIKFGYIVAALSATVAAAGSVAFENFDGNTTGFQSSAGWGRYAKSVVEIEPGFGMRAVCSSSGDSDRALTSTIDLTGDATYYVATLYRVTANNEYGGIKLAQGNETQGPQLLWRDGGGYRLYKDGWLGAVDEGSYTADTTYLGIMKLTARSAGADAEFFRLELNE